MTPEQKRDLFNSSPGVLICNPWAMRSALIETIKRQCVTCARTVAVDRGNADTVERKGLLIACPECVHEAQGGATVCGEAMIGGESLSFDEAREVVRALIEKDPHDA
jgi:DNA-directed RNA polymerase subunit RPC12/RpoP